MTALVACWDCDFVARTDSAIGATGECPYCERDLTPIATSAAAALQIRSRERMRMGAPPPLAPSDDPSVRMS